MLTTKNTKALRFPQKHPDDAHSMRKQLKCFSPVACGVKSFKNTVFKVMMCNLKISPEKCRVSMRNMPKDQDCYHVSQCHNT